MDTNIKIQQNKMPNNWQCVKLFDSRFVANTLKNSSRCPKCRNEYSYYYDTADRFTIDHHVKSNRPILLPCAHNMCENCVYHNRHNLTCAVCLFPVMIPKESTKQFSNFNVRDYFDMNFFLMGQLNHWRYYCKEGSANNTLFVSGVGRSNLNCTLPDADASVAKPLVIKCVECEIMPSLGKCRVCKVYYCKRCFDNVHKNSKVLKMHTLQYLNKEATLQSEILHLARSRFCRKHQRHCDRYCKKCDSVCCGECARNDHQHHHYRNLIDENDRLMEELRVTLDNVQLARENLTKGQKDIKSVETQFEEYATKTLEEISNHFLQLHNFLQNEEKQITEKFSEMSQHPQVMLREANTKLNQSQETLNYIRSTLEQYQHIPPKNFYLGHILPKFNQLIQQIPSNIQISKPHSNPFIFEIKQDIRADIHNATDYNYKDPKLLIKIDNSFYDSSPSIIDTTIASMHSILNVTQNKSVSPNPTTNKNHNKRKKKPKNEDLSITDMTATDFNNSEVNLVNITNIKSPENFYIQKVSDINAIRKLSYPYICNGIANNIPKIITEGYYYMTYHATDKQWYRGLLKKVLTNDLYKIFLVDFGLSMEVSKENLCDIAKKHLKIPFAAMRCAIYDIVPMGKKWTEVENNLLLELLQNKPARVSIIEKVGSDMLKIDLHTDTSKSVHDTFLYTGLARERPGSNCFKLQVKTSLPLIKIEERIPKVNISTGEILPVTVLNVEGPDEFYVIKNDLIETKEELKIELNQFYNSLPKLQQIYLGTLQMCCAVTINGVWYRAIIEEIKDKGQLNVRLVDEGRREFINWRQAFVLIEQFRSKREFTIPCTLADIEPLQENNYIYTSAAIKDFKQMTANPQIRMEVVAVTSKIYKVALYICKKTVDINIGATLVKSKYGVSTGESTQITEIIKTPKHQNISDQPLAIISTDDNLKSVAANVKPIKRTLVNTTHLINPGEFYIQLSNLAQGIEIFHQQIQETQMKKLGSKQPLPYETREWYENNHCLVYTKYHGSQFTQPVDGPLLENFDWYRGIITKITYPLGEEPTFSVFLRDIGVTICSIYSQQLYSIDPQLDRVTNAVYCCHLACIEPAGGKTWSQSAIDSFLHYVITAESLSVTMHSKRKSDNNSLAVILWSSKMETANPLAPCMTKYSNINRNLVRKGLAYMVEPLNTKQQFDQIEEMELANGEITLEQWFKSFSDNALLKEIENNEKLPLQLSGNADDLIENNEMYIDDHSFSKYLNVIDFEPTTGKRAPHSWFSSKVIAKTLFAGYPTYIDFDCIIYLHEANDKKFLEKITKKLTDTYGSTEPLSVGSQFIIGQACVVKYHVDCKYYRGIISEDINSENEWGVHFIDYGNVEKVENKDLRPYAPFPNLPAMASKYIIDGIKPKGGKAKFDIAELDQMHTLLVTKFVSIRTHSAELHKKIKRCTMHLGAIDVASDFIERGLAEADYTAVYGKALTEISPLALSHLEFDSSKITANKSLKSRNPLPSVSIDDYTVFSQGTNMSFECNVDEDDDDDDDDNDNDLCDNSDDDDPNNGKFDHLNEMVDRLTKNHNNNNNGNQLTKPTTKATPETSTTINATNKPPPKKRMFNDNDYMKMMNAMKVYDTDDIVNNFEHEFNQDFNDNDNDIDNEEDEDIIELGESFAMNYWHNTVEDMREEEEEEINEQLERRVLNSEEDIESDFDTFHPNETSTVFSHFSGIDNFKSPQLPTAMHHFNCRVVSIITPTILQIFPLHNEFRYRDVELQRTIKEMVKRSLPPLTKFEPCTSCLACYSKDRIWYRAVIRSHNPKAKTVDVLYVDYLNSETLPVKYIRQCPKELLGWPLRTFRVRLHNIEINPNVKESEIRLGLHRLLTKRELFTVVKKHPISNSLEVVGKNLNKTDHIEVALYESKDASLKGITIYDPLIKNNYFRRP